MFLLQFLRLFICSSLIIPFVYHGPKLALIYFLQILTIGILDSLATIAWDILPTVATNSLHIGCICLLIQNNKLSDAVILGDYFRISADVGPCVVLITLF